IMKSTEDYPTKSILSRLSPRLLIIIPIALILFIPYKTTIVPEWKIRAVDKQGKPIPHVRFRQGWNNDSYDISGMEFLEGDDNGYVILPERSFYAPLIYRIPRSALAYLMMLAHGSVGNDASLNAGTDKCSSEHLNYEQIKALPDVIVIGCSDK
ncbi:MAG: hypothetical protein M3R11_10330, partial [Acidobacteriota bacterium]|nr:hypothetical protein [Acidobacteriota bacterium]